MFQIAISDRKENAKSIEYLFKKLLPPVKDAGGIVIKDEGDHRCSVSLACPDEKSKDIKPLIINLLTEIITNVYKAQHFKNNLKMEIPCLFNFSTLVKTLVAFDREGDTDIAKGQFEKDLPETLALDGYFNFRLTELKNRWNTVIKLTSENALSLSNSDIFLEFISFMLTTIDSKHKIINIFKKNGDFALADAQKNPVLMSELLPTDGDIEENLIATLIFFAPERIILNFNEGISPKTLKILNILFDTKTKAK